MYKGYKQLRRDVSNWGNKLATGGSLCNCFIYLNIILLLFYIFTNLLSAQTGPQITTVGGDIEIKVPEDRRVVVREGDRVINVGAIASDAAS